MKVSYDNQADAAYIYFSSTTQKAAETKEIADEVFVDYNNSGQPIGMEIIGVKDKVPPKALSFFQSQPQSLTR